MADPKTGRDAALQRAQDCGVSETTAKSVCEAFAKVGRQVGHPYDPSTWSKTVWQAEARRYEQSRSAAEHLTLLLHLHRLRQQFEDKVRRGTRAWRDGEVGVRLTKR